jgi:hypothetical protein
MQLHIAPTCTHKREQYTQNGARSTFASFDRLHKRFADAAALKIKTRESGARPVLGFRNFWVPGQYQ